MGKFQDQIDKDLKNVFFDSDTFGEFHQLGPDKICMIIDNDTLQRRGDKAGVEIGTYLLYVKKSDLSFTPQPNADILFDNKHCLIVEAKEDMGMYSITLRQNI